LRVHGSALHGDRCTAGREAHANISDESADNIWNEIVTIHRSQVLKILPSVHVDIFLCNQFFRYKTQVQHSFLHLEHTRHQFSLDGFSNCVAVLAQDF
jgi:hypothetical protein